MKFRSLLLLLPVCLMISCANKAKSDYDMTDPYGTGALDEFAGASPAPSTTPTPSTSSAAVDTTYNSKAAYSDANLSSGSPSSSYTPEPSSASRSVVKKTVAKTVGKKIAAPKKTVVAKKVAVKAPVVAKTRVAMKKAVVSKKVATKKVVEKKVVKPTTHTVVGGDSLSRIASRNGVSVSALKRLNGLKSDVIRPGQKLRVK